VGVTAASHVALQTPQQTVDSGVSNQLNYVGGLEYAVSPRLTVLGDVIGRTFINTLRLEDVTQAHAFQQGAAAPIETTMVTATGLAPGNLTSVLATGGVKFNVSGTLLISAHLIASINSAGLKRSVSPVLGFEYSF
jgi:hypothetical protein